MYYFDIITLILFIIGVIWFVLTLNGIYSQSTKLNKIASQHESMIGLLKEQNRLIQKLKAVTFQHGKSIELLKEQNRLIKQLKAEVSKPSSSNEA
ncbi:MAG: hypothetical protein ACPG8W_07375 [Candidatus Promineifilaceae bacterium]